jgi:fructokinase
MKLGIDLGGTKTEIVALGDDDAVLLRERQASPAAYEEVLATIAALVRDAEAKLGQQGSIGIGIPGSLSPVTGLVRNANSQALNGRALKQDLEALLGRVVRISNDANCLAMSEAADGAGAGYNTVFAVIIGTGTGAGIVSAGRILDGPNGTGGEWGHVPLPWMRGISGPALLVRPAWLPRNLPVWPCLGSGLRWAGGARCVWLAGAGSGGRSARASGTGATCGQARAGLGDDCEYP